MIDCDYCGKEETHAINCPIGGHSQKPSFELGDTWENSAMLHYELNVALTKEVKRLTTLQKGLLQHSDGVTRMCMGYQSEVARLRETLRGVIACVVNQGRWRGYPTGPEWTEIERKCRAALKREYE